MRILMLNWRDLKNPRSGGAEVVTEEVLKRLVQRGHNVTLFTTSFPGARDEEVIDGYRVIRRGREYTIHLWACFYWFKRFRKEGYTHVVDQIHGIPFFAPLYVRSNELPSKTSYELPSDRVTESVGAQRPTRSLRDTRSLGHSFTRSLVYSVTRLLGHPFTRFSVTAPTTPRVVVLIHEVAREIWLRMYRFPIGRIGYTLEPYFFKPYRHTPIITVSHATKRDLQSVGIPAHNISIIPEAVTVTPLTRPPKKDNIPTIIFVGRIAKMKGVHHLLEAYTIAKQSIPTLRLWLLGGGDEYKAELEAQYKSDQDVTFHGFVSEEKKLELLERATILSSASMKEGYGLVIIEAAALGTPSVVYNVDGFNEAVVDGETGILTDPTPQALATGIVSLLTTRSLGNSVTRSLAYSSLQRAAHERSKSFTFDHTTDVFEQILQRS